MVAKGQRAYEGSTKTVAERFNATKVGKMAKRSAFVTPETVVVWVAYAATVACNIAFEAGRLGGATSGEVANEMFVWFMPAGYVFAIWGLIYIALFVWLVQYTRMVGRAGKGVYKAGSGSGKVVGGSGKSAAASESASDGKNDGASGKGLSGIAWLFAFSCALNIAWLALFHFRQAGFALVVIAALLAVMLVLHARVRRAMPMMLGYAPIALYTAWLIVAVVANITLLATWATGGGIPVLNEVFALVLSAAVLAIGYFAYRRTDDVVFPLVILWAVVGVGVHVAEVSPLMSMAVFLLAVFGVVATFASWGKVRSMFAHAAQ